jgi:hypothetical protein
MYRNFICIAMLAGLAVGCTEDTVPTVDTKVDKGQPVTELDEPEEAELCEDLAEFAADYYNRDLFVSLSCIGVAVQAGINPETGQLDEGACDRAYDDCRANPPEGIGDEAIGDPSEYSCELDQIPADCDITVGDLVECTEEAARFLDEYVTNFSCGKIEETAQQDDVGPACQRVEQRCPGLFSDVDSGDEPPPQ